MHMMQLRLLLLLLLLLQLLAVARSAHVPSTRVQCDSYDPCYPGGEWDHILNRCIGYMRVSECYQCYSGHYCKDREDPISCSLDLSVGEGIFFAEFWHNRSDPCTVTSAHYRPGYQGPGPVPASRLNPDNILIQPLVDTLKKLHAVSGNAATEGYNIVPGMGATMSLYTTIKALSQQILEECTEQDCPAVVDVFAQPPNYGMFKSISESLPTTRWNPTADPASPYTIEMVTYPNNPDGSLRPPLVKDPSRTIWDMVYYWPAFTNINITLEERIMIFSSSKHNCLGGTRFGWSLIKDLDLAKRVWAEVGLVMNSISIDVELRVLHSLHSIVSDPLGSDGLIPFDAFCRHTIYGRFQQLAKALANCDKVTLTNDLAAPGAFAWLRCNEGVDCAAFLKSAVNLGASSGKGFASTNQYARVSMMSPSVEFEVLIEKMKHLCSV